MVQKLGQATETLREFATMNRKPRLSLCWWRTSTSGRLRHLARICVICAFISTVMSAETIKGFITYINPAGGFDLEAVHVTFPLHNLCQFKGSAIQPDRNPKINSTLCRTERPSVGTFVVLTGRFTKPDNFAATNLEVVRDKALYVPKALAPPIVGGRPPEGVLIRDSLAEEWPDIPSDSKASATWWLDGYPMTITQRTQLLASNSSKLGAGEGYLGYNVNPLHIIHFGHLGHAVQSSKFLGPNIWSLYHYNSASASQDSCVATRIRVWPNTVTVAEKSFLAQYDAEVSLHGNALTEFGTIQFAHGPTIPMLTDLGISRYIARVGESVVPEYQKNLVTNDAAKINFRFYVVRPFIYDTKMHLVSVDGFIPHTSGTGYRYNEPIAGKAITAVIAVPNGMIIVPDTLLGHLRNEAQLASLLSDAVTSVVQKQGYRAWAFTRPQINQDFPAMQYLATGEKAALIRIGMRHMYLAGYDLREAPYVFSLEDGVPTSNPLATSARSGATVPWYVSYTFSHISEYYQDIDYSKLKRGEAEYQQFLRELRKADPEAFADAAKAAKP